MEDPIQHLYIHVPFCPKKCAYCAFITHVGSLKLMGPYLAAMLRELTAQADRYPGGPLTTVYFGGGTPSLMTPEEAGGVLGQVAQLLGMGAHCEVTLEAHPSTVTRESLAGFRQAGVTRISFGAESLDEAELAAMGREHSAGRVAEVVGLSRAAEFQSVGLDLMYGLPGQTAESWDRTLRTALLLRPDHLSLYPLMVEARTPFGLMQREGRLALPVDEVVAQMYRQACRLLRDSGYEHYEIANWARPGHRCAHNLAYWLNRQYLAVGVGAHGSAAGRRWENVSQTRRYIDLVGSGQSALKCEELIDDEVARVETIMLRTRLLADGLPIQEIAGRFGQQAADTLRLKSKPLESSGLLSVNEDRIRIPEDAALLGNEIWQALI